MLARADSAEQRARLYAGFRQRNRLIGILRWGVPLAAAVALVVPAVAAIMANIGVDFSIGRISLDRDALVVEAPQYSGVASDGSTYKVTAASARAALGEIDVIALSGASLRLLRPDGVEMRADAAEARLNTTTQVIAVPGLATVSDSTGSHGTLMDARFDWPSMELVAEGPVSFAFGDGTELMAEGLRYQLDERKWQFEAAVVLAPSDAEIGEP